VPAEWTPAHDRLAALREAFDRSFADAPAAPVPLADLLDVRLGSASYALRVTELSGLFAALPLTRLPSPVQELLGLTAVRGAILPVYDLRALLGYAADETPGWVAIAASGAVGLAFDAFNRHLRVPRDAIIPHAGGDSVMRHVREMVQLDGRTRPIISVASVLDDLASRVRSIAPEKE